MSAERLEAAQKGLQCVIRLNIISDGNVRPDLSTIESMICKVDLGGGDARVMNYNIHSY